MSDTTKIGAEVDKGVWQAFRNFVQDRHGRVRGTLGEEVEKALEDRMAAANGPDQLDRIEDDVAQVKAMLAAEADGGTDVEPADPPGHLTTAEPHTHTDDADDAGVDADDDQGQDDPVPVPDELPHHRASSRRDRAAWLYGWICDDIGTSGQVHRNVLSTRAAKLWGYDRDGDLVEDLAEQTLDLLDDRFDIERHPTTDGMFVWGDRADEVWEEHEQQARQDAADRGDELDAGHPSSQD